MLGLSDRVRFRDRDFRHVKHPTSRRDFMSSVLDHLHFPMLAIDRMLTLAKEYVLLDTRVARDVRRRSKASFLPPFPAPPSAQQAHSLGDRSLARARLAR